jgi:hypothetical protein
VFCNCVFVCVCEKEKETFCNVNILIYSVFSLCTYIYSLVVSLLFRDILLFCVTLLFRVIWLFCSYFVLLCYFYCFVCTCVKLLPNYST